LTQALAGPALIWNDSILYIHIATRSIGSSGLWAGARPPVTSLLIKLAGSSRGFLATQAAIAALCWGFLAFTVGRLAESGWKRVAAAWAILAFATAFPVTLWNRSVLSESLSMSLLALLFALLIWTAREWTWPRIAATTVVCLCFAATRDAQIWTVALLAVAIAVRAIVALKKNPRIARRAASLSACLLAVVVLTGWGTVSSHRTRENVADVFYVRIFPFPTRVAWFAAHGMPQQGQVNQLARSTESTPNVAKVVYIAPTDSAFAPLDRWLDSKGSDAYFLWLLTHPGYAISEPLQRPERSYDFANGDLMFYAAQAHQLRSPLTVVVWPSLIGLLVQLGVAVYVSLISRAWRQPVWRMVFSLTVIGVLSMLVAWHGDGQEVTRHTVEGLAELRLGLWIIILNWLFGSHDPALPARPTTTEGARR
jgi:hypothetical protein